MRLELEDVHVSYGKIPALRGVSLAVNEGEVVAVIGANGAGKTTMLNAVSGLVRVAAGQVAYDGRVITRLPTHQRVASGICHVPEGRRVFAAMTVEENLQLGAFVHDRRRRRSGMARDRVFEWFPILSARARQPAGTLSGGEQQMLAIGRALMGEPRLLLMDEPSLGLAPQIVSQMFGVIREICSRGMTLVLVEQNAFQALKIADHAYVLEGGGIAHAGNPADLLANDTIKRTYLPEKVKI